MKSGGIFPDDVFKLIQKYNYYQDYFEKPNLWQNYCILPILVDILASGCNLPYAYSTYDRFDDTSEKDMLEIIRIHYRDGYINFKSAIINI